MKTLIKLAGLLAAVACLGASSASRVFAHGSSGAPRIVLLSPREGAALNAATLEVQALVAAFHSDAHKTFVFDGKTIAGRNAGRVRRVEIALDGVAVHNLDTRRHGRQLLADFRLDLAGVPDGVHTVTVAALQDARRGGETRSSAQASFTLDRTLVAAEPNRIEEAATPRPFGGLVVRGSDGRDDDDDEEEEGDWQCPSRFDLKSVVIPSRSSDGIDFSQDRVVLGLGGRVAVLEPGALRCAAGGRRCQFEDPAHPLLQSVRMRRQADGRWTFRLRGGPLPADDRRLYLRIGNDWGGIDLETGERLAGLRPALDTAREAQAVIGAAGGMVETTDAAGVRVRLDVPAGALALDTTITITPLTQSPRAGAGGLAFNGVKLEPEGLAFATPATLTVDVAAAGLTVLPGQGVHLVTSPLTVLPLVGTADIATGLLTAEIRHFSVLDGGPPDPAFTDFQAWADSVLSSPGTLTISELQILLALAAEQMQVGCTTGCIDLARVAERARETLESLVTNECPLDTADPSDAALRRYLIAEMLAQQLGVSISGLRECLEGILRGLIERAGRDALADASEPNRQRLASLAATAQGLGFADLETLALQRLDQALQLAIQRLLARVSAAQGTPDEEAVTDQVRTELEDALLFVTNAGAEVLRVDPALADDLQAAIDSLSDGFQVKILRFSVAPYAGSTETLARIVNANTIPNDVIRTAALAAASTPPRVALNLQGSGASIVSEIRLASPRELVLDADMSTPAPRILAVLLYVLELTFPSAGTVTFAFNPSWMSNPDNATPADFQAYVSDNTSLLLRFIKQSSPGYGLMTATRAVSAGETMQTFVQMVAVSGGGTSGRALTITYTR